MKFTEFLKDYLHDCYGLLWRCSLVSLIFTAFKYRKGHFLMSIQIFLLAFVVYFVVDVILEWIKTKKEQKEKQ